MNTSKIIKGVVGNGRYTVTAPIVKEDSTGSGYSIINETASGVSFPERTLGTYTEDL